MRRPAEVLLATAQATGGPGKTMLPLISPLPVAVYVYWTGQSTGRGFESRPPRCRMRSKMKQETLLDLGDVFIDVCAFDIYNKDYLLTYLLTYLMCFLFICNTLLMVCDRCTGIFQLRRQTFPHLLPCAKVRPYLALVTALRCGNLPPRVGRSLSRHPRVAFWDTGGDRIA